MNTENLIGSLKQVRGEALDMLENVKAVRGEKFSRGLQSMLIASQLADITRILFDLAEIDDRDKASACMVGVGTCVGQLMENLFESYAFTDAEAKELVAMHDRMAGTVSDLIKSAVDRENQGKGFGNAH